MGINKDIDAVVGELKNEARRCFEQQTQLAPFYVGHIDKKKKAIGIADRAGNPIAWVSTDRVPIDIAMSLARLVAESFTQRYDALLKEYDEQTGELSAFRENMESMPKALEQFLAEFIKNRHEPE